MCSRIRITIYSAVPGVHISVSVGFGFGSGLGSGSDAGTEIGTGTGIGTGIGIEAGIEADEVAEAANSANVVVHGDGGGACEDVTGDDSDSDGVASASDVPESSILPPTNLRESEDNISIAFCTSDFDPTMVMVEFRRE